MFPIKKQYIESYYRENDDNKNDLDKIKKNLKNIINEAQEYLNDYENGIRYNYCVNIDAVLATVFIESEDTNNEVALAKDID